MALWLPVDCCLCSQRIHVFTVFWTPSVFILVLVDALWCAVSDCVITLWFIGRFIVFFIVKRLVVSTSVVLAAAAMFSQACRHDG